MSKQFRFNGHGQLRTTHKYTVSYEVTNHADHPFVIGLFYNVKYPESGYSLVQVSSGEQIDFDTFRNMVLGAIAEHEKKLSEGKLVQDLKVIGADGPLVIESFTNGVGSRIEAVHNLTKFVFAGNREFLVTHRLDNIGWTLVSIESLVDKKQYTLNELSKLIGKTFLLTQKALLVGCPNE